MNNSNKNLKISDLLNPTNPVPANSASNTGIGSSTANNNGSNSAANSEHEASNGYQSDNDSAFGSENSSNPGPGISYPSTPESINKESDYRDDSRALEEGMKAESVAYNISYNLAGKNTSTWTEGDKHLFEKYAGMNPEEAQRNLTSAVDIERVRCELGKEKYQLDSAVSIARSDIEESKQRSLRAGFEPSPSPETVNHNNEYEVREFLEKAHNRPEGFYTNSTATSASSKKRKYEGDSDSAEQSDKKTKIEDSSSKPDSASEKSSPLNYVLEKQACEPTDLYDLDGGDGS